MKSKNSNDKAIVRLPDFYKWVGIIGIIFGIVMCFPDLFLTFKDELSRIKLFLALSPLFLVGFLLALVGCFWEIQVDKTSDYFIYRTTFGRTYKIFYNKISYFKTLENVMIIKYKRNFFLIHPFAINYQYFLQMLIKKDVKKKFKPFKSKTRGL